MTEIPTSVIATIQADAAMGVSRGRPDTDTIERAYLQHCAHIHWQTGTMIVMSRDLEPSSGLHMLHLGISFRPAKPDHPADIIGNPYVAVRLGASLPMVEFNNEIAAAWVRALYGDDCRRCWRSVPVTRGTRLAGQPARFWLPCNAEWHPMAVLTPVYERQFRALGWKPFSEVVHADAR